MSEILGAPRVGYVDNRRAIRLLRAGERIQRAATVMTNVSDPASTLHVDHRLIGTPRLKVVGAQQPHIHSLGALTTRLFLGVRLPRHKVSEDNRPGQCNNHRRRAQFPRIFLCTSHGAFSFRPDFTSGVLAYPFCKGGLGVGLENLDRVNVAELKE